MRRCLGALVLGLLALLAPGQTVSAEASGHGAEVRRAFNQAKTEHKAGWPDLANGDRGTLLAATFDLNNADLTLLTADLSGSKLLAVSQRAARASGYPQADYLTFGGSIYESVDIELNDSLVRRGDRSTSIEIPLGRVLQELRAAGISEPIAVSIRVDPLSTARLGNRELSVGTHLFLPDEIDSDAVLTRSVSRPAWAIPAAVVVTILGALIVLGMYALPIWTIARIARPKPTAPVDAILPPEEVQAKYDATKPWLRLIPLLPLPFLLLTTLGKPWIELLFAGVGMVLPPPPPWTMLLLFVPLVLFLPATAILARRRKNANESPPSTHPDDGDPAAGFRGIALMPLALLPGLLLLVASRAFPGSIRAVGPMAIPLFIFLPMALTFVLLVVTGLRQSRVQSITLVAGDPIFDEAHRLADRAGVRIRKVVVRRSPTANAFADLGSNVGVTTRLRRELPPEEVRAILAHEIGHLRHRHVWRGFAISLTVLSVWLGVKLGADDWMRSHLASGPYALWSSPVWGFLALPIVSAFVQGRGSRRREFEADRFAAEAVGDPEIVIRALERTHHLSQLPGALRKSDEALSTHPSLVRRIAALRSQEPAAL